MSPRRAAEKDVWRISVVVPKECVGLFEEAFSPHCDALSWLEEDEGRLARLNGYVAAPPDEGVLARAVANAAAAAAIDKPTLDIRPMASRDWVVESLQTFPPVLIGRYYVHGAHVTEVAPRGMTRLCIEAGPAFGTGAHESTAGCLVMMDGLARHNTFRRILDVGCGSGILSLAAAKTWPRSRVLGVDMDVKTMSVARGNARINGRHEGIFFAVSNGYDHPEVRKHRFTGYDLIIANILARPLMRLAHDMGRHLKVGGIGILSGFLARDERQVLFAHRMQGLSFYDRVEMNGWVALAVKKGPCGTHVRGRASS